MYLGIPTVMVTRNDNDGVGAGLLAPAGLRAGVGPGVGRQDGQDGGVGTRRFDPLLRLVAQQGTRGTGPSRRPVIGCGSRVSSLDWRVATLVLSRRMDPGMEPRPGRTIGL